VVSSNCNTITTTTVPWKGNGLKTNNVRLTCSCRQRHNCLKTNNVRLTCSCRQIHNSNVFVVNNFSFLNSYHFQGDRSGRDPVVVGLITTYAISAYHHWCCEFKSRYHGHDGPLDYWIGMNPNKNLIEPKPYMNPTKNLIETKLYINPTKIWQNLNFKWTPLRTWLILSFT
jgi:hypothetical protein